jgi:AraC-like DNA-binding protein
VAILFDSSAVAARDRDEALTDLFSDNGVPIRVSHDAPDGAGHTILEHWALGEQDLFVARGDGLRLTRSVAEVRAAAPAAIRLGYQIRGRYTLAVERHQEMKGAGHVNIVDQTKPVEFTQYGRGAAVASFNVTFEALGLPPDTVRAAGRVLKSSPVHGLLGSHMARLCQVADSIRPADARPLVADATVQLARATIASVGQVDLRRLAAFNDALYSRIVEYVLQHLADPGLSPRRIAVHHNISVRNLYRLWAHNEVGIAEWIASERLAGAAAELQGHERRTVSIAAVAHSWGFVDASHFSRRFRQTYDCSPQEWRAMAGRR